MKAEDFTNEMPGRLVPAAYRDSHGVAFLPDDLPPSIAYDQEISFATERAAIALGNLNGSGRMLPNSTLLLRPFVSREALASSRIEGTRAEYGQLLLLEATELEEFSDPDYQEVHNYITTLYSGWNKLKERSFSTGFLMELHGQLLRDVRGSAKHPGQLREG